MSPETDNYEYVLGELAAIKRAETRVTIKDLVAIGTLLVVLGGGIVALYTRVEHISTTLDAHIENMGVHPGQDERRQIVREEIDRALMPVLTELQEIKMELMDARAEAKKGRVR